MALKKVRNRKVKSMTACEVRKRWQKEWECESTGRHLYKIQEKAGKMRKIGKHENGKCNKCGQDENIEHVIMECEAYERQRFQLTKALNKLGIDKISLQVLLGDGSKQIEIFHNLFHNLKRLV
ncbi:Competence protein ComM [Labeo rohita]|uniref:Competence protein ComM n=1 Tax=Labeo rohita TaxID=84645 RepID=A0ABQ8L447_LABRO|nr:Competence protein ComM [Labeo rohita]